ncbi:MAG: hypothetical protein A2Y63_02690 [Candidatus Riflebacteria bacterium RBG_13_59_9]|nr:MAG: hypothetical protein A2Y63_02690 [Candidatus Riflebacteria bacterium RBG_13_59_9]
MIPEPGVPESFHVMMNELRSLGLDVSIAYEDEEKNILFSQTPAETREAARLKEGEEIFE